MDVKTAVRTAKTYVLDLFSDESISDLGLEEVALDDQSGTWLVTLGFTRPWDKANSNVALAAAAFMPKARDYKIVSISDKSEKVLAVKNREVNS